MNKFRLFLLPFSWIYGWVLYLRNILYNNGFLKSNKVDLKTIVVGNLALGGTGKTPQIEALIRILNTENVAVLSRGYSRKTTGTIAVRQNHQADDVGDEPLQIARKFPNTPVVVDENRLRGIKFIQSQFPEIKLVVLDDALQHRKVQGGFNILLTTFDQPFFNDFYLPAGDLRDHKVRAKDADVIIVTKCPKDLNPKLAAFYRKNLKKFASNIFFSTISYDTEPIPIQSHSNNSIYEFEKFGVITGIAGGKVFLKRIKNDRHVERFFEFRDHHNFTIEDMRSFAKYVQRDATKRALITTEKDAMRLNQFMELEEFKNLPIFVLKIKSTITENEREFENLVNSYAAL